MSFEIARPSFPTGNPGFLPMIIDVKAMRVRYERPRVYYLRRQRRATREAVEIIVRTADRRRGARRRIRRGRSERVSLFRV